jgi:hypothetical protein
MTEVLEDWEEDFEEFDLEDESEDERVAAIDEESDRFERGAGVEPTDEMAAHWHPDRLVWHHPGEFAQLRNELALAGDDLELDVPAQRGAGASSSRSVVGSRFPRRPTTASRNASRKTSSRQRIPRNAPLRAVRTLLRRKSVAP